MQIKLTLIKLICPMMFLIIKDAEFFFSKIPSFFSSLVKTNTYKLTITSMLLKFGIWLFCRFFKYWFSSPQTKGTFIVMLWLISLRLNNFCEINNFFSVEGTSVPSRSYDSLRRPKDLNIAYFLRNANRRFRSNFNRFKFKL